jgi:hypothetical protein
MYIDFAKAFDSIVLSKLLLKLELYGISGSLLKWISGFLTNRTQCVVIYYCFSTQCAVTSGVPQGSVLGTPLFIVSSMTLIPYVVEKLFSSCYADDAKLYSNININNSCLLCNSRFMCSRAGPKNGSYQLMLASTLSCN